MKRTWMVAKFRTTVSALAEEMTIAHKLNEEEFSLVQVASTPFLWSWLI